MRASFAIDAIPPFSRPCLLKLDPSINQNARSAQPVKVTLPTGAPMRKSWYVDRHQIVQDVYDRLCRERSPTLVALVGESGSGKTTVAVEFVMDRRVQSFFSDGIIWLSVDDGATDRLPSLMKRLAGMVDENMSEKVRQILGYRDSGTEHIKRYIDQGRQGQGLRCLVVADNVWNPEVVQELKKTGMWILITTRDQKIMARSPNDPVENEKMCVEVHEMVDNAKLVLTRAADLPDDVQLPDAALEVVERCGRMAMDLAFVGSWDLVRGRNDRPAWQDAVDIITTVEQQLVSSNDDGTMASDPAKMRREVILCAGYNQLEPRVQTLYSSLAVMPHGHIFTMDHAAVLLYDRECTAEDKAAVKELLGKLERWSVLESRDGRYKMHGAHANIARKRLQRTEDVRACAVQRWTKFLSTLAALLCFDGFVLKILCSAVRRVGGDGQVISRQWKNEVEGMKDSNPHLFQALWNLGRYFFYNGYWSDAIVVYNRFLHLFQEQEGVDNLSTMWVLGHLVECTESLGQVNEANEWRQKQRKALSLAMKRVTKNSQIDVNYATALEIGKSKLGEDDLQVADTLHELGEDDVNVAVRLHLLGVCLRNAKRYDEAQEVLRQALEIKKAKLGEDDLQVAVTLHSLAVCLRCGNMYDEAAELLRQALEIKKAKLGDNDLQVAATVHELGVCLWDAKRYDEVEVLLRQALEVKKANLGDNDLQVAGTLHHLGVCLLDGKRYDEVEELLRQALGIEKEKLGEDDLQVAVTLHELGVCLRDAKRYDEAKELLRQALEIKKAKLGEDDFKVALTLHELGACLRDAKRYDEAEELLRQALEVKKAKLGEDDLQVAVTLHELGACLWAAKRYDEVEVLLRQALGIEKAKLSEDDLHVAVTLNELGVCLLDGKRYDEVEELLRQALGIEKEKLGEDDLQVGVTLHELGVCLRDAKRYDEAEELLRQALGIEKEKLGEDDLQVAVTLHELGVCLRDAKRYDEAAAFLRQALEIKKAKLGEDDLQVAVTLYALGVCLRCAEMYDEAEELLRQAFEIEKAKLGEDDLQVRSQ